MRKALLGLTLCVTCLAAPRAEVQVVVPSSAFHPQNWLRPQLRENPKPGYRGKSAGSLAGFVSPEVISKIVVDQYAGSDDAVRRYLTAMPTAAAEYFGTSLELCKFRRNPAPNRPPIYGARLEWTSTSVVTFESGRIGRLAVATVVVSNTPQPPGLSDAPNCLGLDKVPVDSLYVSYIDPDGYSWSFAIPLQKKQVAGTARFAALVD
jgi:hypothetical protein